MIRTTLSCFALFGSLIYACWVLQSPTPATTPQASLSPAAPAVERSYPARQVAALTGEFGAVVRADLVQSIPEQSPTICECESEAEQQDDGFELLLRDSQFIDQPLDPEPSSSNSFELSGPVNAPQATPAPATPSKQLSNRRPRIASPATDDDTAAIELEPAEREETTPTAAPLTAAPSIAAPSIAAPSIATPSTAAPSTAAPSTAAPSTAAPSTAGPSTGPATTGAKPDANRTGGGSEQPVVLRDNRPEVSRPEKTPPRQLSPQVRRLRDDIARCLKYYYQRPDDVAQRSPWGIMHCMIAFGVDTPVFVNGRPVNAVGYLCWNGSGRGQRIFYTENGAIKSRQGPGVQGHEGQFLAMLAQSKVRPDFDFKVDGYDFTIEDLIAYEQRTCRLNSELTFKLIGLIHYLPSDSQWKDDQGGDWDFEQMIREELKQPIVGAACGGTHRLMGFSYALQKREQRGEPMDGQWLRARKYIDSFHRYSLSMQNPDGSLSTNWFKGRGFDEDKDRRIQTTGHILEWLLFSLPDDEVHSPQIYRSVRYLTTLMLRDRQKKWEIGPKGHALRALINYDRRVLGGAAWDSLGIDGFQNVRFVPSSVQENEFREDEPESSGGLRLFRRRGR